MPKERDIFQVETFRNISNRKVDLINKLTELHKALSDLSQEPSHLPRQLKDISSAIVQPKILNHTDRDVRLLSCCCIVDILRVYAPESPITDDETITSFEVMVNLLRGLANHDASSPMGEKLLYILTSIATIKSCVVPVILTQNQVKGAEEVVMSMFEALLSSIRPTHSEEVLTNIYEILHACVSEMDGVHDDVLDILLQHLLPAAKQDNPLTYKLVSNLIRSCSSCIEASFTNFVNDVLVGTSHTSKSSELAEHIYPLLYEIHKIAPLLMVKILPSICMQLQVDEEDIRTKATKLLGLLFASTYGDYGEECPRNFREFMSRFNDKSASIRLEIVECSLLIMKRKPGLRKQIEDALMLRMRDNEADVRMRTIQGILEVALENPLSLASSTFDELCHRILDRKVDIRRAIMIGLSRIYQRYISSTLPVLEELDDAGGMENIEHIISNDLWSRLKQVPNMILKCWGYPDMPTKHLVIQLVQESLLPKTQKSDSQDVHDESDNKSSKKKSVEVDMKLESKRATALILLCHALDAVGRQSLATMMSFKTKIRADTESYLRARQILMTSKDDNKNQETAAFRRSIHNLTQHIPISDSRSNFLENLYSMKDKLIFKRMESMVSSQESVSELLCNRDDLRRRLDSKSALSDYIGCLYDCSSYLIANENITILLINHMVETINKNRSSRSTSAKHEHKHRKPAHKQADRGMYSSSIDTMGGLLTLLAKHASQAFRHISSQLTDWFNAAVGDKDDLGSMSVEDKSYLMQCVQVIDLAASTFRSSSAEVTSVNESRRRIEDHLALCNELLSTASVIADPTLCSKLASAAARIVISLLHGNPSESSLSVVRDSLSPTFDVLTSKLSTDDLSQLPYTLIMLTAMVKVPMPNATSLESPKLSVCLTVMDEETYRPFKNDIISFLHDQLFIDSFIEDIDEDSEEQVSKIRCVCAGMRLYAAIIAAEIEAYYSFSSEYHWLGKSIKCNVESDKLIQSLFECLDNNGSSFLGITSIPGSEGRVMIEETSALIAYEMLKLPSINKRLSIPQWHRLGWMLLHDRPDVRQHALDALCVVLQTHNVPPQYLSYLCLLADDENLRVRAESVLLFAVKRLRVTYDELCGNAVVENSVELRQLAEEHIPEILLAYAMHLLSYHPDFPASSTIDTDEDKRRMGHVVKSLKMILRVLIDSNDKNENLSYLIKQVNIIDQRYEDRHDPDNIGIGFVARTTLKLLKERIRTAENVQVFPGDIYLPRGLFQLKDSIVMAASNETSALPIVSPTQMDNLLESDQAIDNALHRLGKTLGKSSKIITKQSPMRKESTPKSVSKPKPRALAKAKPTLSKLGEDAGGEDHDSNDELSLKPKKGSKAKAPSKASSSAQTAIDKEAEASARRSNRIKTLPLDSKMYTEPEENEKEIDEWNRNMAEKVVMKPRASTSSTASAKPSRSSAAAKQPQPSPEDMSESDGESLTLRKEASKQLPDKKSSKDKVNLHQASTDMEKPSTGATKSVQPSKKISKENGNDDDMFNVTQTTSLQLQEKQDDKQPMKPSASSKPSKSKKRPLNTVDSNVDVDTNQQKISSYMKRARSAPDDGESKTVQAKEAQPVATDTSARTSKRLKPMRG